MKYIHTMPSVWLCVFGATKTSMATIAIGMAPKPIHGLTLPSLVRVLSIMKPVISSITAPMMPATRKTVEMLIEITLASKPLPLNAKSAK